VSTVATSTNNLFEFLHFIQCSSNGRIFKSPVFFIYFQ
jgi:hypothetical protein